MRASQNLLYPERPVYRVMLDVESADPPAQARQHSWRGRVSIHGDWEAPGARLLRTAASVFWREAGFWNWRVGAGRAQCITRAPLRARLTTYMRVSASLTASSALRPRGSSATTPTLAPS